MRPGRELDVAIAKHVFGYDVRVFKKALWEAAPKGSRPLRFYTKEIAFAWEVADKMNITLIPVENGQWFAMVGREARWSGPAAFITYLQTGDFVSSGAAVEDNAAMAICLAALRAIEHRTAIDGNPNAGTEGGNPGGEHPPTESQN